MLIITFAHVKVVEMNRIYNLASIKEMSLITELSNHLASIAIAGYSSNIRWGVTDLQLPLGTLAFLH